MENYKAVNRPDYLPGLNNREIVSTAVYQTEH